MGIATRAGIEQVFGATNVATWADRDGDRDAAKMDARIARSCEIADETALAHLRTVNSTLTLPSPVPPILVDCVDKLAGIWLYEGRGFEDTGEGEFRHRYGAMKREALQVLTFIARGVLNMSAPDGAKACPTVVRDCRREPNAWAAPSEFAAQ